ncbi:MAG TPA: hypothetical protein VM939_04250 [Gemmatimonadaceae bacterium]|nr:hypothetical protein [Gemmatimonadaceae bacterium]
MTTRTVGGAIRTAPAFAIAVFVLACTQVADSPAGPDARDAIAMARSASSTGITVSATTPSYGQRGETGKPVTITGSGFSPGALVTWERNGVVDPNIVVQSATVVSSTQINAVISISETADLSLYDVGVMNLDRKKGVGTEQFEVTTATSIGTFGGNTEVSGTNDQVSGPRAVGWSVAGGVQNAFYWPGPDGKMASLGAGVADAISADGVTIAGLSAG